MTIATMTAKPKKFLTLAECSELFRLTPQTIRTWSKTGRFPQPHKPGHKLLFPADQVERVLRGEWSEEGNMAKARGRT
jgi:predicted site-specific integrase-resolvase